MNLRSRMKTWWKAVTQPTHLRQQVRDEFEFHIETCAEDLMRNGMPRAEAMRRARAELGSIAAGSEQCRAARGTRFVDELRADLRFAARRLAKSPSFAAVAIGSLALGIGANTAIFSIAKHVLLDRLNVPRPSELRLLQWTSKRDSAVHSEWGDMGRGKDGVYSTSFSYPIYEQLRKENRDLSDLFAFKGAGRMDVTVDGQAEVVQSELVSGNYYTEMEVQPQLGRAIGPEDDSVDAPPVATISDGYWAKRFNRSTTVIGRTILVNLQPITIVGVNPPGFTGAKTVQASPDIFAPLALEPVLVPRIWTGNLMADPNRWWLQIMARTRPRASEAAAQAQLNTTLQNAVLTLMKPKKSDSVPRLLLTDGSRGMNEAGKELTRPLTVMLVLVGMVLVLACANLANLLLARSTAQQREISVRLALGAGRARILRHVLTESLLLAFCGGALGLLVAYMGRDALLQFTADPTSEAAPMQAAFSWGVFAFNAALSLLTGLIFGLAPAWQSTRTQVRSSLQTNTHTVTRRRAGYGGKAIVGFQIAVSMLLVCGAGMFLRTLVNLNRIDPGFEWKNLVLFQINPPQSRYPEGKAAELYGRLEARLAATPGVESETVASLALLSNDNSMDDFTPTGVKPRDGYGQGENDIYVGDDYFATMRIPMVAGRSFTAKDTAGSLRVAVVNEALLQKYFPGQSPIGKTFTTSDAKENKLVYTIVGVCANTRYADLRTDPPPIYYLNYRQAPNVSWGMTLAVRTRMPRAAIVPTLRAAVQSVDQDLPLMDVRTQQEQIEQMTISERMFADLTGGFGLLALVLASIGIYGVLAYSVSRRTSEIGIRMALGAQRQTVLAMVLGEAVWMSAAGVAAGTLAAVAMGRLIASMLFGLKAGDPATLVGSAALLALVAIGAAAIPARRAATVDPIQALRHE
jgi:predicted permease